MNFKIIFVMLIFFTNINIVNCDESGILCFSGSDDKNYPAIPVQGTYSVSMLNLSIADVSYHSGLNFISYKITDTYWSGSTSNSEWYQTDYKIGGIIKGSGNCGVNKHSGYTMVYFLFNSLNLSGLSGVQHIEVVNHPYISTSFYSNINNLNGDKIQMYNSATRLLKHDGCVIMHTYEYDYPYNFYDVDTLLNFQLDRDTALPALKVDVYNQYEHIYDETSFLTTDINFYDVDIINKSWNVTIELVINNETKHLTHNFPPTPLDTDCRIETDNLEIGDTINVSYFNINDLRDNPNKYGDPDYATCNINIQVIADRGYYEELIYQDLITDETDNIFYYSSVTLNSGIYYTQINKEFGGLTDYVVRTQFIISQPVNYSIITNPDSVYVGDNINIIYKTLNQSTISIYDNSSVLIKSYLNIENEGQKIFQIPPDYDYNNNYPNWYVYLNDTGNSSNNLRYNFTVNWKVYIPIKPTPQPTEDYYNETIEDNIDEIRNGLNPIKQFIFGLSTIFIDNPDYDNNDIVDVNEISVWLNSLISIAIIIFIYILYTVYKRG